MAIDLKPEQQRVIDLAVRSGAYQNPDEVLDQAFEIIREQLQFEDWMTEQRETVAAHIEIGFAQAERGELIEGDAAAVNAPFQFTPLATEDLDAIWWFIADDNPEAADRVEWRSSPPVAGWPNILGREPSGGTSHRCRCVSGLSRDFQIG